MGYRFLADAIVILHLAFVAFVVFGGLLVLRWRRVAWYHLPAAAWGAWIEFADRVCPLTPLENRLRETGGGAGYEESFIEHYLLPVLYPSGMSRAMQIALGCTAVIVNIVVYTWVIRRARALRRR